MKIKAGEWLKLTTEEKQNQLQNKKAASSRLTTF